MSKYMNDRVLAEAKLLDNLDAAGFTKSHTEIPNLREIRSVIPAVCFERSFWKSVSYLAVSLALTGTTAFLAWLLIPLELIWFPIWLLYSLVCGTFAMGIWVSAHECGHRAFCSNTKLQDAIGFVLHSSLLVPYFSWQRSHAVHHAKTNHVDEGETFVPKRIDKANGKEFAKAKERFGENTSAVFVLIPRLLLGWPIYLMSGWSGSPQRGKSNHFWPWRPFNSSLFPKRWSRRVAASSLGVLCTVAILIGWSISGNVLSVLAVYGGPYVVVNVWLVTYTWLHHTDVDIPHYDSDEWSFVRGAFCSVDRPYGRIINFLHHNIGSTHVVHHLDCKIPHYNAGTATDSLKQKYSNLYRFDPTPIPLALWRVASKCFVVRKSAGKWLYQLKN